MRKVKKRGNKDCIRISATSSWSNNLSHIPDWGEYSLLTMKHYVWLDYITLFKINIQMYLLALCLICFSAIPVFEFWKNLIRCSLTEKGFSIHFAFFLQGVHISWRQILCAGAICWSLWWDSLDLYSWTPQSCSWHLWPRFQHILSHWTCTQQSIQGFRHKGKDC